MAELVTWKKHIQPMLNLWGEIPDMIKLGFNMNDYDFVAGNYKVMRGRMADGSMPPGVSDENIAFIENWIHRGALAEGFEQVKVILDRAIGGKETIGAHGTFWRNKDLDAFKEYAFAGEKLLIPGDGKNSNLVKALKGEPPFDGKPGNFKRMPERFWWTEDERANNVKLFEQWKADGFLEQDPFPARPPLFSKEITPVVAESARDWAAKILSIPVWAKDVPIGTFDPLSKAMKSVVDCGFQSIICGQGTSLTDVVSVVAVSGPGASVVDVALYSDGTGSNVEYQGWTGSTWADGPAVSSNGVFWYRAEIKPSATVFYAKTYRQSGGTAQPFNLWAFQSAHITVTEDPAGTTGFSKVVEILDAAVGGPDASVGAHGPFWRGITKDEFVGKTVFGQKLIEMNNGPQSNLVKALKGEPPFDGNSGNFRRMPAGKPPVSAADIQTIQDWINNGCPTVTEDIAVTTGFSKVVEILDAAVGGPDASVGAHGPFWRGITKDEFVGKTIFGQKLIEMNNGAQSNLVKALKGEPPFDGSSGNFNRMPARRPPVSAADIQTIQDWIDNGCPN